MERLYRINPTDRRVGYCTLPAEPKAQKPATAEQPRYSAVGKVNAHRRDRTLVHLGQHARKMVNTGRHGTQNVIARIHYHSDVLAEGNDGERYKLPERGVSPEVMQRVRDSGHSYTAADQVPGAAGGASSGRMYAAVPNVQLAQAEAYVMQAEAIAGVASAASLASSSGSSMPAPPPALASAALASAALASAVTTSAAATSATDALPAKKRRLSRGEKDALDLVQTNAEAAALKLAALQTENESLKRDTDLRKEAEVKARTDVDSTARALAGAIYDSKLMQAGMSRDTLTDDRSVHHCTTAPPHHRTNAPPHHRTTAPPHHCTTAPPTTSPACQPTHQPQHSH